MTDYNVIVEVAVRPTERRAAAWMGELEQYSPAVGRTSRGMSEIVFTVPGHTFDQAIVTASSLAFKMWARTTAEVTRFEVITTEEFDRRVDDIAVPELVGATEAAEMIGISRQRVQQLAANGGLPSTTVGRALVFPRDQVEAVARLRAEGKTVDG